MTTTFTSPAGGVKPNGQPRPGRRQKPDDLITLPAAAALLEKITGRRVTLQGLADIILQRPHLALFEVNLSDGRTIFRGVRQKRWQYFLQARLALCGKRGLFHLDEL